MVLSHFRLFLIFIFVSCVNLISTIHFYPLMLLGLTYYIYSYLLSQKNYYKLIWSIFTFVIFEINFGFPIFSIILLSYFIHILVIPFISSKLSFNKDNYIIIIFIFYIIFAIFMGTFYTFSLTFTGQIFINYIIELIIWLFVL
jgi:hypothetical protein